MPREREIGSPSTHFRFCVLQVCALCVAKRIKPIGGPFFPSARIRHCFCWWVSHRSARRESDTCRARGRRPRSRNSKTRAAAPLAAPQHAARCISAAQPENALCTNARWLCSGKKIWTRRRNAAAAWCAASERSTNCTTLTCGHRTFQRTAANLLDVSNARSVAECGVTQFLLNPARSRAKHALNCARFPVSGPFKFKRQAYSNSNHFLNS